MTRPFLLSAPAPARNEDGFTLLELAVTMLVFGIVMTFVAASFLDLQQGVSDNFVRQAETLDAQGAMQVISDDVRAIADDQTLQVPLITTMGATTLVAAVNIDTTSTANPGVPLTGGTTGQFGSASAYTGCPDRVTITGRATSPGPITVTRVHPSISAGACAWISTAANTYTTTVASHALLSLTYCTVATAANPCPTSNGASTTASVEITVTGEPASAARTAPPVVITEITPLAAFNASLST